MLTIYAAGIEKVHEEAKETTTKANGGTTTKTTTKTIEKLVELIKENPSVSSSELAEQLHISRNGVRYHLKKLTRQGILKRIGSSKTGYWEIDETLIK